MWSIIFKTYIHFVFKESRHTIQNGKANDSKAIFQNSFCIHRAYFDKSSFDDNFTKHIFNGLNIYYLENNPTDIFAWINNLSYSHQNPVPDKSLYYKEGGWHGTTDNSTNWIAFKYSDIKTWIASNPNNWKEYFNNDNFINNDNFTYQLLVIIDNGNYYISSLKKQINTLLSQQWYENHSEDNSLKTYKNGIAGDKTTLSKIGFINFIDNPDDYILPNNWGQSANHYVLFGMD